jgi:hypothetical protein
MVKIKVEFVLEAPTRPSKWAIVEAVRQYAQYWECGEWYSDYNPGMPEGVKYAAVNIEFENIEVVPLELEQVAQAAMGLGE